MQQKQELLFIICDHINFRQEELKISFILNEKLFDKYLNKITIDKVLSLLYALSYDCSDDDILFLRKIIKKFNNEIKKEQYKYYYYTSDIGINPIHDTSIEYDINNAIDILNDEDSI